MNSLEQMVRAGEEILSRSQIEDAGLDAMLLWEYCSGKNSAYFWTHKDEAVSADMQECYRSLVKRRAQHIPLQYITGVQEFMGFQFHVNEHVLIPRQDTEILVEEVQKDMEGRQGVSALDLCTGSGCIILSLKKLGAVEQATACDISEEALKIARENGRNLGTTVKWLQSDLYEKVEGKYDVLISNPPYIETDEIRNLMPEVRDHEPLLALDGSQDGLFFYRTIISGAQEHMAPQGRIYLEIGCSQGEAVGHMLLDAGFEEVTVIRDLAGLDRVIKGKRPKKSS